MKNMIAAATLMMFSQFANAIPILNSTTGLAAPGSTLTFDEHVLPVASAVTNQYADLGVTFSPNLYYSSQTGFPNITGNTITNFGSGASVFQFSLNFLADQSAVAFAMVSNASSWTFEALLNNAVIESFSAIVGNSSAADFFGFTGITFDQIRITSNPNDFMIIDNLQMSGATAVPEPGTTALLLLALAGLGAARQRRKA